MRRREEQSAAFRDALWVSRCVGHAGTTPLRLEDVEDLARFIRVLRRFAGSGLVALSYGKVQILDAAALAKVSVP